MESYNMVVGIAFKFFPYSCRRACRSCSCKFRLGFSCNGRSYKNYYIYCYCSTSRNAHVIFHFSSGNFPGQKEITFRVDKHFRRLQLLSAAAFSLGHGGNDAQKSMGIIWVALIVTGLATKNDPIALMDSTLMSGSNCPWNIIWRMENSKNNGTKNNQAETF